MKQHKHKFYTSISLLLMICFTVAISIFTDWYWASFLAVGGYILRTTAEFLDERALTKAEDIWRKQEKKDFEEFRKKRKAK